MTDSWDDIEFLARSKHRFRTLEALSERPYERAELQQETDGSRTTIQRTLSDMEEKGWIESAGWRYKLTELGDIIRSEFDRVLGVAGAVQELNQVIEWVPVEAIDIDLHYFRDATISVASRNDPTLPVREYANLLSTDGHVRGLIYGLDSRVGRAQANSGGDRPAVRGGFFGWAVRPNTYEPTYCGGDSAGRWE